MASPFLPNQNVNADIAAEAPGHVFAAGTEPWLDLSEALDCLRLCSLSPGQRNRWITGQGYDKILYFTDIRTDEIQGIAKIIMASTTSDLRSNQPYWRLNDIKVLVHWCRSRHTMGF